jgi:hypothetical protein
METTISTATPGPTGMATPETGTSPSVNGNGSLNGEANRQGATGSETFIPQGVDLNTLPPQLRQHIEKINSDMVRGFTEKTTKVSEMVKAETAKAVEAFRQKADFYDAFVQNEDLVKTYNDYVQRMSNQTQTNPNDPTVQLQEKLKSIELQLKTSEMEQVVDAFANAADEKGNKLNSDFDKLNSILVGEAQGRNGEKNPYSILRAAIELATGNSPTEKLANGYKSAKAVYDAIFEEGKKAGMGRLQDKARNGTFPPSSVNAGHTAPGRPKNALEALEFARRGLAPNRG